MHENASVRGIINMSYGWAFSGNMNMAGLTPNSTYENSIVENRLKSARPFTSNVVRFDNYYYNKQLRIAAIGNNTGIQGTFFNSEQNLMYQVMSPEMQKAVRNDVIIVKNANSATSKKNNDYGENEVIYETRNSDGSTEKYYEFKWDSYDSRPMLLRGYTVGENGKISSDWGSSFSAPRVSRLAYDIKTKFPFLTWNQVKQVILTTATRDDDDYLSDSVGWGIVNRDKALKGPSDLNAGLIEEEKYYIGNLDKIFEGYYTVDKENNTYTFNKEYKTFFYADVQGKDSVYTWENDITSGLKGNGNNKDYHIYNLKGGDNYDAGIKDYKYKIPVVLDSEKNFYANVRQAGLRKAGEGTLILKGKQYYTTDTQVLVLDNDSNSRYIVGKLGTLVLGDKNDKARTDITVANHIYSDGVTNVDKNVNMKNYYGYHGSTLNLTTDAKLTVDELRTAGTIALNFTPTTKLTDINKLVNANKIDISKAKIANAFLTPEVKEDGEYKTLHFNSKILENIKRMQPNETLESLTPEEKRNLPSFDDNNNNFFDVYVATATGKVPGAIGKYGNYNPMYKEGGEVDTPLPVDRTLNLLHDYKDDTPDIALNDLFTDNYANIVGTELLQNLQIKSLIDKDLLSMSDYNRFQMTADHITNRVDNKRYNELEYSLRGNRFMVSTPVNDRLELFIGGGYFKGQGIFTNKISSEPTNYKSKLYAAKLGLKYKFKNVFVNYNLLGTKASNEGYRNMQGEPLNYDLDSRTIQDTIGLGYKFQHKNMTITPYIDYTYTNYRVTGFSESATPINEKYVTDISGNHLSKHNASLALKLEYSLDKWNWFAISKYEHNFNPSIWLNTNTLDVDYQVNAVPLYRNKFEFSLGSEYAITLGQKLGLIGFVSNNNKYGYTVRYELQF